MLKRIPSLFLVLALLPMGFARADDYAAATEATRKGDYATAFGLLKPLAEKGDARAQTELGAMYMFGRGAPRDPKEAIKWTTLAAEHGSAVAQANLGTMYLEGQGVQRDYKESMKWSLLAAGQGVAAAQMNVASLFYEGNGVKQDYKEAAKWVLLAAEQGDAEAQLNLGAMYVAGQGVDRDLLRGYMWTHLAIESPALGMTEAEKKQAHEISAKTLSAEELPKAEELVKKCKAAKFKNCGWARRFFRSGLRR
jgi:TPR repeat protein